jgi:sarcosine oxidase subunit alpha
VERIKNSVIRGKAVSIVVDGKRIKAYENETVGIAILAAGKRTLARSIKFHRPRSMFCSTGNCHRCLMEIDGIPNRRVCLTYVRDGMTIRSQNSFPNAEKDLLSFIDKFSNYLQTSIYHHHFLKPKFLRQTYLKVLKRFTGLGRLDLNQPVLSRPENKTQRALKKLKSEIVIAGAGLTGLCAALSAADAGASVLVLEEKKTLNGQLSEKKHSGPLNTDFSRYQSRLNELEAKVKAHPGIKFWQGAILTGIYEGIHLGVVSPDAGIVELPKTSLIIATGAYDAIPVFRNNELPGIFSARLVEKMVYDYGIKPGRRALIWGSTKLACSVAEALIKAKTKISGFVTASPKVSKALSSVAIDQKIEIWTDSVIFDIKGKQKINSVIIQNRLNGKFREIESDVIVVCHLQPRYELQLHAGCEMIFDEQRGGLVARTDSILRSTRTRVYVAGEALETEKDNDLCVAEGKLAGYVAAQDLGYSSNGALLENFTREVRKLAILKDTEQISFDSHKGEGYVCFCQDVKAHELLGENETLKKEMLHDFRTELIKRRTGILTGPCQGKSCLCNFLRILAKSDGKNPSQYPIPTVRPPVTPLRIYDLAQGDNNGQKDV